MTPRPVTVRRAGLVVGGAVGLAFALAAIVAWTGVAATTELVVRDAGGHALVRTTLRDGDPVVLRYRNSLYGSVAEERFVVHDGALRLAELAADERAVLDEYYALDRPAERTHGDARAWRAVPREPLVLTELAIAATDLGERTLLLPGRPPFELWRHALDVRPTVHLQVGPAE